MGNYKNFFKPQRMGFHLVAAVIITLVLIIGAIVFIKVYTRHGQEVEMPDFIGQDSELLIQDNQSGDFIFVVNDYIFDKSLKPGTVMRQNPEAGELIKKGRKVYITVASPVPPKVKMPELKDVSLRQAEIMLKALGLELGDVILKPSPYENAVLEQLYNGRAIAQGTEISVGDKITLVVGRDVNELPTRGDSTLIENQ